MQSIYDAAGGFPAFLRLAAAWHERVLADEVVAHAFSHGYRPDHSQRLAAYWAEALGGPPTYTKSLGTESCVVAMHSGNGEHSEMDRRAIACFDGALVDAGVADDPVLRQALHDYFAWTTTTSMSRYPGSAADVPQGMPLPRWSWDGLINAGSPSTAERNGAPAAAPGQARVGSRGAGRAFGSPSRSPDQTP